MMQMRRYFAVQLISSGKLKLIGFLSESERKAFCEEKENHCRKVTMKQWRGIPKDMKA